ncbi:conjugal transfer protein TraP, partial [Escherichia coli]|uniref:conjugal transfer protein TraP n=1 Tax=Escherichia coli TaxID=562 RepID=UPI0035E3D5BC
MGAGWWGGGWWVRCVGVACVVRWGAWVVGIVVFWPLATMALMALVVLWKDNT